MGIRNFELCLFWGLVDELDKLDELEGTGAIIKNYELRIMDYLLAQLGQKSY